MTALQTLFEFYASLGDEDWPAIWFFLILIFRTARRPIKAIRRDVQLILLIMVTDLMKSFSEDNSSGIYFLYT